MSGSAAQREREREVFEGFLKVAPEFKPGIARAGWTQPAEDPPDVGFIDTAGRRVGVELKAWLNEDQIAQAKRREATEAGFLAALAPQPRNTNNVVSLVWPRLAKDRAPKGADARAFKGELLSLIEEKDREWSARAHEPVQGETVPARDFGKRPTLQRYLEAVCLFPRKLIDQREENWITFPSRGGAYDEIAMLTPLQDLIADTREKYATTKQDRGLDRFVLLIHYDGRAWQYNSPIEAPDWDFDLFASQAAYHIFALDTLSGEPSPWDEVFLFDAVKERWVRVHPCEE